jgi:uncharacterized coiled-coil protein SlyX
VQVEEGNANIQKLQHVVAERDTAMQELSAKLSATEQAVGGLQAQVRAGSGAGIVQPVVVSVNATC